MQTIKLTENEARLVEKLRSVPSSRRLSLVRIIVQLLDLESSKADKNDEIDYQNNPVWKLVGSAASGIKNDDSALNHDNYLYGQAGGTERSS